MIYYNVTSQLDKSIETEWLRWMQEEHIPEMLSTNYFIEVKVLKIKIDDENDFCNYATQYLLISEPLIDSYIKNKSNVLRRTVVEKFGEKVLSFRTKLEIISEHK